jgi:hypothetical protein
LTRWTRHQSQARATWWRLDRWGEAGEVLLFSLRLLVANVENMTDGKSFIKETALFAPRCVADISADISADIYLSIGNIPSNHKFEI